MNKEMNDTNKVVISDDPVETPRRVAFFPKKVSVRFKSEEKPEKLVTSFPHLIIREVVVFQILIILLAVMALLFNAPLEELANPQHTPNPAKAPWYFLGLQELLHYFPPVVAGVLVPLVIVLALVFIPYFDINIKRESLWQHNPRRTFLILSLVVFVLAVVCSFYKAFSLVIPTVLLYLLMVLPFLIKRDKRFILWLSRPSLADWIMTWFVLCTLIFVTIGIFFRGPGWSWVWPWK